MSYVKHTWVNNEAITASKMNNIEDGIEEASQSGGGGAVIITDNGTALDKTYAEIYALIESGTPCYISYTVGKPSGDLDEAYTYHVDLFPVVLVYKYDNNYRIMAVAPGQQYVNDDSIGTPGIWTYSASDSSSYPTFLRRTYVPGNVVNTTNNRGV